MLKHVIHFMLSQNDIYFYLFNLGSKFLNLLFWWFKNKNNVLFNQVCSSFHGLSSLITGLDFDNYELLHKISKLTNKISLKSRYQIIVAPSFALITKMFH